MRQQVLLNSQGRRRSLFVLLALAGLGLAAVACAASFWTLGNGAGISSKKLTLLFIGVVLFFWGIVRATSLGEPAATGEQATPLEPKWVALLGVINLVCFLPYVLLSYGMFPLIPYGVSQAHNASYFERIGQLFGLLGPGAKAFVTGDSFLADARVFVVIYSLPLVVSSVVFVALIILLARHRDDLSAHLPRTMFGFSVALAVICFFASPVLVNDFWYGVSWGRMVAAGVNPYYNDLTRQFLSAVPHNPDLDRMTWGPLVAVVSGAAMWLVGGRALLGALVLKLVMTASWIVALRLIWSMLSGRSLWQQCLGIAMFGWLPLSFVQSVADGHNDILMALFMLLWLYNLERGKGLRGSLALAASIAVKYTTAPLVVLDVLHLKFSQSRPWRAYVPQALAMIAFLAVIAGLFFRSPEFFAATMGRAQTHFFSLREAVITLEQFSIRRELPFLADLARLIFPVIAVIYIARYVRQPDEQQFRTAVLATMLAMLFGYISGLFPWYLIWGLAAAALVPGSMLTRWMVGIALFAPFVMLVWVAFPAADSSLIFDFPGLALYSFAGMWLIFAPRHWFEEESEEKGPATRVAASG